MGLERQKHMSQCVDQECASVWSAVVKALPEDVMKFALNADLYVRAHNHNIHLRTEEVKPCVHPLW
jgi:hypothetical protein